MALSCKIQAGRQWESGGEQREKGREGGRERERDRERQRERQGGRESNAPLPSLLQRWRVVGRHGEEERASERAVGGTGRRGKGRTRGREEDAGRTGVRQEESGRERDWEKIRDGESIRDGDFCDRQKQRRRQGQSCVRAR